MRKALSLILLSVTVAFIISACGTTRASPSVSQSAAPSDSSSPGGSVPLEVTIIHPLGTAIVKTNPATVVVFDYGTLDTLDKLGIEVKAVPQDNLPAYLAKYKDTKYENAGTLFEPDFEKLSQLKPDLILIGARTAEAYSELSKLAPTILISVDNASYMQSFEENAGIIGQIFTKEIAVDEEISAIKAGIADLKGKSESAGKALIMMTSGGKLSAYGSGSRFGFIHDVLGFKPVDDKIEISNHGQSISNEYIAEKNPDILFVVDRDSVTNEGGKPAKEMTGNILIKKTNAFLNGKIIYLDPEIWYQSGGGLVSVGEMVKEAAQAVQ